MVGPFTNLYLQAAAYRWGHRWRHTMGTHLFGFLQRLRTEVRRRDLLTSTLNIGDLSTGTLCISHLSTPI